MKAIGKDFVREVKNTRSRFISILILVTLAVAFLSGLRATAPDMKLTLDDYLDQQDFMDIQVLSTLGVTDDDVDYLRSLDSVSACEGAWMIDAIAAGKDSDLVAKVWSVPDEINRPVLREGRLPEAQNECAIEKNVAMKLGVGIGDVITIIPKGDFEDTLFCTEYTVVGRVSSPYYVSLERGTSSIGTGSCAAYLYLDSSAFDMDYYTAAFVRLEGAEELRAFYDEYEDFVDAAIDELEPLGDLRAENRYDQVIGEANEKLDDARKELDDAKADAEKELNDAAQELADARQELDDGWQEYYDGQKELEDAKLELADGEKELADAKKKVADGKAELADAEQKYNDGVTELEDGKKKLEDARTELADGWKEYNDGLAEWEDGRRQLDEAKETFEKEKADGQNKLNDALAKLTDGEKEYADGLKQYESGLRAYKNGKSQLEAGKAQLDENEAYLNQQEIILDQSEATIYQGIDAMAAMMSTTRGAILYGLQQGLIPDTNNILGSLQQIEDGRLQLAYGRAQIISGRASLDAASAELISGKKELNSAKRQLADARQELDDGWQEYNDGLAEFNEKISDAEVEIADGEKELLDGKAELDDAYEELMDGEKQVADAEKEVADGEAELADAAQQLEDAKTELADAEKEIKKAEKKIRDGKQELADGEIELADAYKELTDGEEEYADGLVEYEDGKKEADEKIGDAEEELADARRKLADIEDCEWYVLGRETNPGYLGFGQDADRMGNLASVFPVLFFLVAALVCLTTMTRMVDEQRIQIGSLKALGYSSLRISMKYIAYGALPALIGGILGLAIGYTLFPKMIFTAYQIMYDVPNLNLRQYTGTSVGSVLAAVATTTVSTLWACLATLREVPAELMRPRAPKPGKRVILEYIKPLWKRMNFFSKVTTRNLFRYQKRFWMTVIGIGGCTALTIAGLGIRSSLLNTMSRQYDDIYGYHAQITVENNMLPEERQAFEDYIAGNPDIQKTAPTRLVASTGESESYSTMTVIEAMDPGVMAEFVKLRDYKTGENLTLDDSGVIIDQKLSELLDIGVGDSFTLDNDGYYSVTVSGISEFYLGHYAFMTPSYYEKTFGEECTNNCYLLRLSSDSSELCYNIFSDMMSLSGVSAATRNKDTRDTYMNSMERVDFVLVIVILSAAALAVVVLYNLSNINITERRRELATIKVLGFYDLEVSRYVYRENIVLTMVGIGLGIALGRVLHAWLVKSVEIELMMFGRDTEPQAFVIASLLTVLFSVVVNVMAHRKMKKIDMVESLKSAE